MINLGGVPTCGNKADNSEKYNIFHISNCLTPDVSNKSDKAVCKVCKNNFVWNADLNSCVVGNCASDNLVGNLFTCT